MSRRRIRISIAAAAAVSLVILLALTARAMGRRASDFRRRANREAVLVRSFGVEIRQDGRPVERAEQARLNALWREHHEGLRRKYDHAAGRPWLPVSPDSPDPVDDETPGREVRPWTEYSTGVEVSVH
jgi:hypothetical protein